MATEFTFKRVLALTGASVLTVAALAGCNPGGGGESSSSSSVSSASSEPSSSSSVSSSSSSQASSQPLPSGPPVQSRPPNASNQTPAFPEQTRAPGMDTQASYSTEVLANGFDHPWSVKFLPDGRALLTERGGTLHILNQDGSRANTVSGLPDIYNSTSFGNQGGLLDVSIAPDFESSRWVYLSYSDDRGGGQNATNVARGRLSADESRLEDVEVIFEQTPAWSSAMHFGSRLAWSPEGYLYITLGERSDAAIRDRAQSLDSTLGKVVRVNPDGSVPSDNPFVGQGLGEIWSYGHRNIQAADIHPETGELWTIEHGPQGGDELNKPEAGKNYGWPVITYGVDYGGGPIGQGITSQSGMEQPVYYWDPVIAPSGMIFYRGDMFEEWRNNIFVGSLNPGGIVRLMLHEGQVVGEEILSSGRIRDVEEAPDGSLWYLDDGDGSIRRLYKR